MKIDSFSGAYRFLSNFSPAPVEYDGQLYPTVENAYQAAKTVDKGRRQVIRGMSPGQAKRYGRHVPLRPDWERVKVQVMLELLRQKFASPVLSRELYSTGDAELVEGNYCGDTYCGVCKGVGENALGKLLMQIRGELKGS